MSEKKEKKKPLAGRVALVTGAAQGIGLAVCERLVSEGVRLVMTDSDAAVGEAACERLAADGGDVMFLPLDVTSESQWQAAIEASLTDRGGLDILVNNAGLCLPGSLENLDFRDFQRMSRVNVDGAFLGTRAAILAMRRCAAEGEAARGAIVNIASIAGQTAIAGLIGYCATKAALTNMTRALAVECAERREFIRINAVLPGTVRTAMSERIYGQGYFDQADNFAAIPLKSYAGPADIAGAVAYLVSDRARLVTGSELTIDGGFTAGIGGGI